MKTIEIEDDLYKYILNNIQAFGETPSQILRRLLVLPEDGNEVVQVSKQDISPEPVAETKNEAIEVAVSSKSNEQPEPTKHDASVHVSVAELFNDASFSSEPVITNTCTV